MTEVFNRFAPFIQEFIYRKRWDELRDVQIQAASIILDTDAHLLLATPTSSGKTEAALFPILTILDEDPACSIGALYIGPLTALINDQFERLDELLDESHIPVWKWHGGVAAKHRKEMLAKPRGILQITPESLESTFINRKQHLPHLFADLRFVVIDEVHAFMGSDRGAQVQCLLKRLERFCAAPPRRIGLSATLGDYTDAAEWLKTDSNRDVLWPKCEAGKGRIQLAIEHFIEAELQESRQPKADKDDSAIPGEPEDNAYSYIFSNCWGRKCIVFANSRRDVEDVAVNLRHIAKAEHLPDIFHVHHGSISDVLREEAERAMRDETRPAVTVATVTLELGIDIGQLERVIQLQASNSVSSFVQRLGRSGRRGQPSQMWIVCAEKAMPNPSVMDRLPWSLLQAIACVQLYAEEHWIEPFDEAKYPFSLLYHQTMSVLHSHGELSPAGLASRVLTLPPFAHIGQEHYRRLLRHLLNTDHIERTETGGLIIGLEGEKVVRDFRFYAVFQSSVEYDVVQEARKIGSISHPPPRGERFGLAGRTWEVTDIDEKSLLVYAREVKGGVPAHWRGSAGEVHTRVLQRMRQVLTEDMAYPYLQPRACERLEQARALAGRLGLSQRAVLDGGGDRRYLLPWRGSRQTRTLRRALSSALFGTPVSPRVAGRNPYYLTLKDPGVDERGLTAILQEVATRQYGMEELLSSGETPLPDKYDRYLPAGLLRLAYFHDRLDISSLRRMLSGLPSA